MQIRIFKDYTALSEAAADLIADLVRATPTCVLGLATGSTPIGTYDVLAARCATGEVDFSLVRSYNLDEYYPMAPEHEQSYHRFMDEHLFNRINIDRKNTHVPDGMTNDPAEMCRAYDAAIEAAGGIDLQLLGIGQNGHIGFNEPGASLIAPTHLTPLTENTISANARFFASRDNVPTHAVSMGMASILHARRILLLVSGKSKHEALMRLYNDAVDPMWPATFLKLHRDAIVLADEEAYHG